MNLAKLTALAERVANLNAAAGEIGAGMLAQLVSDAQDALQPAGDTPLHVIQERWATRKWPSIGYFVHGQAYQDIHNLLAMIAELRGNDSPRTEYDKGAAHCAIGIRAGLVNLPRYELVIGTFSREPNMLGGDKGDWLKRSDVLECVGQVTR